MESRAGVIIAEEVVVSIGFFAGLWIYLGLDPNYLLIEKLAEGFSQVNSESGGSILTVYYLFSVIVLIMSLLFTYILGGLVGILAVFLAFMGGIFIGSFGWIFLIVGYLLGLFSPELKNNIGY